MNNKKLALAVMAVLLVAGLIGTGIMAWFTSQKSIENNLFQAGTLVIELAGDTPAEALMEFENMQPGDVEEATAVIKNAGSLPFKFYAIISEDDSVLGNGGAESEGGYLPDALDVTVTMGGGQVYKGTLTQLLDQVLVFADEYDIPVTIAAGATANIGIKVEFNTAAGNEYQGASFTGTITFIATQVNNPAEWQSFAFEKDKETEVSFPTQGVEMKVKAGEDSNTVISVERFDSAPVDPPAGMDPAGIYLNISANPPMPEGSEVVLEVSYAHLLPLPAGFQETAIKLFHFNDSTGEWEDITESVDTVNKKIISKAISSFSVFGIYYDMEAMVDAALDKINNVPNYGDTYTFEEDIELSDGTIVEEGTTINFLWSIHVEALMLHALRNPVLGLDFTGFDALSESGKQMAIAAMNDVKNGHLIPGASPFKSVEQLQEVFDLIVEASVNY